MRLIIYLILLVMGSITSYAAENVSVVLKVKFKTGGVNIDKSSVYVVNNLYGVVDEFPQSYIFVVGHTDSVGNENFNMMLSNKRADHITTLLLERGAETENITTKGMGEKAPIETNTTVEGRLKNRRVVVTFTQLNADEVASLKNKLSKTEGLEIIKESNIVASFINENIKPTEEKPLKKKSLRDLNIFSLELASFHSELASEVVEGINTGNLSDEVLTDVRVSINAIQYDFFIKENQYIAPIARVRWYEFSNEISNFLIEDETKYAFSLGVGYGYIFSDRLRAQVNLVWEQQLYYSSPGANQPWSIDTESSIRLELQGKYVFLKSKYADLGFGLQAAYLANGGDLENGHNVGAELFVPFGKKRSWYAFTRYQVNTFDLGVSEITHEILELGLGYKVHF